MSRYPLICPAEIKTCFFKARPIISIVSASDKLTLTTPTVTASLKHLEKLGIVREVTGGKYARLYAYHKYLKILNEGTEPLE